MQSIMFVRNTLHDSTEAIPRAICASQGVFDKVDILCWNRAGIDLPARELRGDICIRRFGVTAPSRSLRVIIGIIFYQLWAFYYILRVRPSVIQSLDLESTLAACAASVFTRSRIIYDIRDPFADSYNFPKWLRRIAYAIDWLAMWRSAGYVIPAEERAAYLGRWARSKRPLAVVHNMCEDELSSLPESSEIPTDINPDAVRIGYIGYLAPSRGGQLLLDLCGESEGKVAVIIAGQSRFQQLTEMIENCPYAYLLGLIPRLEALAVMRDVHLVSLLYDPAVAVNKMAAPNKFYESLSVGTPVLVSKGMSIAKMVEDAGLGWAVDYGYSGQLTSIVEQIRNNSGEYGVMRQRCRDFYLANFSYEKEIGKYRNFYRNFSE